MTESSKNEVDDVTGVKTTGHEWDGIRELDNPMRDPGDGTIISATNISIVTYAGDGKWCRQEDIYNPLRFVAATVAVITGWAFRPSVAFCPALPTFCAALFLASETRLDGFSRSLVAAVSIFRFSRAWARSMARLRRLNISSLVFAIFNLTNYFHQGAAFLPVLLPCPSSPPQPAALARQ